MFIVLDTETTGKSFIKGDRLIEIGACRFVNREYVDYFHTYLKPGCAVSLGALKVHGLSDQFLKDKPEFSSIAGDFLDYIKGADLVIHNAPFDIGFLDNELSDLGLPKIAKTNKVIDTLPMARELYPGQRNSLDALCKRLSVDASAREKHGALLDAKLLAEVYLIMTSKQNAMNILKTSAKEKFHTHVENESYNFYLGPSDAEKILHENFLEQYLSE